MSFANHADIPRVAHVFDRQEVKSRNVNDLSKKQKEKEASWNGTLFADRVALKRIGNYQTTNPRQAERMITQLKWNWIISVELQPQGPWIDYAKANKLLENRNELESKPRNSKDEWRGLAYPFWHPDNEVGRKGMARHVLSCLPGLRVISIDLGHRYAAPDGSNKNGVQGRWLRVSF
jgi:hypothetical protein